MKITLGDELGSILEDNLKESIFAELYIKGISEINTYLKALKRSEEESRLQEEKNNIFAFIGERGSGKTSCMRSLSKALCDSSRKSIKDLIGDDKSSNKALILDDANKFYDGILVDPSFFDKQHNILTLLVAKMFKQFKDDFSKLDKSRTDYDGKSTLIKYFERVQKNMQILLSDKTCQIDGIESLVDLSAAVDLRSDIEQLITEFLKFRNTVDNEKYSQFVIMIDDIDLNTKHAREMSEQIRKYLTHSNIIVLMAVKIDQLGLAIKNTIIGEYNNTIRYKKAVMCNNTAGYTDGSLSDGELNEMVERYLGKLIPHNHRFYIPNVSVFFDEKLEVFTKYVEDSSKSHKNSEFISERVSEGVLELIFRKTRYLFYNTKEAVSFIIPRNLRELRQLIAMLIEMDNFRDAPKEANTNILWDKSRKYNQTLFLKYFLETWCLNNLSSPDYIWIKQLFSIVDPLLINKSVVKFIGENFKYDKNGFENILSIENLPYNISLGDVLSVLDKNNSLEVVGYKQNLIFAIRFFYSSKLYEYYNLFTESNDSDKEGVYREAMLEEYSYLEKLISGTYINLEYNRILRQKSVNRIELEEDGKALGLSKKIVLVLNKVGENFEIKDALADISTILNRKSEGLQEKALFNAFVTIFNDYKDIFDSLIFDISGEIKKKELSKAHSKRIQEAIDKILEKKEQKTQVSRSEIRINLEEVKSSLEKIKTNQEDCKDGFIELIYVLISSKPISPNRPSNWNFRKDKSVRFDYPLQNKKYIYLDITSPFFTLIDLKKCYSRFSNSSDFFYKMLKSDKSLIARLVDWLDDNDIAPKSLIEEFKKARDEEGVGQVELEKNYDSLRPYLLSIVVIRNIEVLNAVLLHLNSIEVVTSNEANTYKNYFNKLSSFKINTYDRKEDGESTEYYSIDLSFFKIFADIIEENQTVFNEIISFESK